MSGIAQLFLLQLDDQRYALHLAAVSRVVRMVEIAPLPKAQPALLGLVNLQGEVLPVVSLRRCLGHPDRQVATQDVLVVASSGDRKVALAADAVGGVISSPEQAIVADSELLKRSVLLEGVLKLASGLVLVCNLEKLFTACDVGAAELTAARPGPVEERGEGAAEAREKRRLLRERAQKLAREPVQEESSQRLELVEFLLSDEHYAIESNFIREVYPLKELTPLPCTPPFVLGVVNIRGKILSVIDLRRFFDLAEQGLSDLNKVLILYDAEMEFGLLADAIVGVRTITARELQPSLPTLTEIRADYLKGVTKERLVVLDAGKMLADRRIVVHDEA